MSSIGTNPDQIPVNGMLGKLAFKDSDTTYSGAIASMQTALTIASATTIAPTTLVTFISGTTGLATITPPTNLLTSGGFLILIPTGIFTTVTTGNIALATTTVVNKALIMVYDALTAKWYPSY